MDKKLYLSEDNWDSIKSMDAFSKFSLEVSIKTYQILYLNALIELKITILIYKLFHSYN